jgi:hypothetical protein
MSYQTNFLERYSAYKDFNEVSEAKINGQCKFSVQGLFETQRKILARVMKSGEGMSYE